MPHIPLPQPYDRWCLINTGPKKLHPVAKMAAARLVVQQGHHQSVMFRVWHHISLSHTLSCIRTIQF